MLLLVDDVLVLQQLLCVLLVVFLTGLFQRRIAQCGLDAVGKRFGESSVAFAKKIQLFPYCHTRTGPGILTWFRNPSKINLLLYHVQPGISNVVCCDPSFARATRKRKQLKHFVNDAPGGRN